MPVSNVRPLYAARRSGSIAVPAAFCLVIVTAFLAFSLDLGFMATAESDLQNAADAAAISGASVLPDREAAVAAAQKWAEKHWVGGTKVTLIGEEDVEFGTWDQGSATFMPLAVNSSVTPDAIRVSCRRSSQRGNPLQLFFAPIFGTKSADLTTISVAQKMGNSCNGIMALDRIYLNDRQAGKASYTDSYDATKGDYYSQAPGKNGDVCTNGHLTLNGNSFVNGDAKWWERAPTPKADASQVSGEFKSFKYAIDFPEVDPGNAPTVNDNGSIPLSSLGNQPLVNGVFTLTGNNETVTLKPGTYFFNSMTVSGGAKVFITGPTFIYTLGTIDLRYGGVINQTLLPINLQFYPLGGNSYFYLPFFGELHAVIYSTKADIYLNERKEPVNLNFFGKMVGQKILVWDTAMHVDESISFERLKSGGEQIGKSTTSLVQ